MVTGPGQEPASADIWLRDGLIEAVGPALQVPAGARVMEAEGLFIYAGFIDGASAAGLSDMKHPSGPAVGKGIDRRRAAPARTEITRKGIAPDLHAADFLALDVDTAKKHHKSGFTAALVGPRTGILAGLSALVSLSGEPRRASILASPVAMNGGLSARGRGYPTTLMGSTAHFRQAMFDAERHRTIAATYARRPRGLSRPPYDPALIAMAPVLSRQLPLALRANSSLGIQRALRLAKEFDFKLAVDGGQRSGEIADMLARRGVFVLLSLDFDKEPTKPKDSDRSSIFSMGYWARHGKTFADDMHQFRVDIDRTIFDLEDVPIEDESSHDSQSESAESSTDDSKSDSDTDPNADPQDDAKTDGSKKKEKETPWAELPPKKRFARPQRAIAAEYAEWEEQLGTARLLAAAGVPFALTSGGSADAVLGNIEKVVEYGLTADQALSALTVAPAEFCGVSDRMGTIESGKIAHLTILNEALGTAKNSVAYVYVDGKEFEVAGKKEKKAEPEEGSDDAASDPDSPKPISPKSASTVRLDGQWDVAVTTDRGAWEMTWNLAKSGQGYEGSMENSMGNAKLTSGKLSAAQATLNFDVTMGDRSFELVFKGTISGSKMEGTMTSSQGERAFSATRTGDPKGERR